MARAGSAWWLISADRGEWSSIFRRFGRWQEKGVWQALLDGLADDADREWLMIDSTIARRSAAIHPNTGRRQWTSSGVPAHACAAGARERRRAGGGFSSQLHGLGDSLGNSMSFVLTAGQSGDAPQALPLL